MHCNVSGTVLIRALPPLLVTEFVLGVLGNGLALWIFCFHLRPWKSSTVLLFNLAVADFLLNMALPFRVSYYIADSKWDFGGTFCNICLFMLAMNRGGSTLFLMAIAVDRYLHVVHPHHPINSLSVPKVMCGALVLWLIIITMTANIFTLSQSNTTCSRLMISTEPGHNLTWYTFGFLVSFFVPLIVILYCTVNMIRHLRRRQLAHDAKIKKALRLMIVVVVLFIVCFLPSNIVLLIRSYGIAKATNSSEDCSALEEFSTAFNITVNLTCLNSALDPVVYYFSSSTFRSICRKVLRLPQAEAAESSERKTQVGLEVAQTAVITRKS